MVSTFADTLTRVAFLSLKNSIIVLKSYNPYYTSACKTQNRKIISRRVVDVHQRSLRSVIAEKLLTISPTSPAH